MDVTRWDRVQALFESAKDLDAEARERLLARSCEGDESLRAEVAELLAAADEADGFFAGLAGRVGALFVDDPDSAADSTHDPESVGAYRICRRIARGGMGTVYLAERADGRFEHRVAIKLLRPGFDTEDLLRRFRAERQILASLSHPNIARLLDGGATADERPYLVMELVEGLPITEHCDRHGLSVEERLRLFLTVGRAVQYAHQNLVVHRDLKPSNIMVTADGTVKLLDFGIAKLLDASLDDVHTQTGLRLMTPEYASPEQVQGKAVTTASDVYQLGVLLYELLVGQRPYELHKRSPSEVERVILTQEPLPPSAMATTQRNGVAKVIPGPAADRHIRRGNGYVRRLRSRLRGDLDTIVLMALRKEPERRYASAADLVDDIERHLGGRPVTARPDTWSYRARKFTTRNPAVVVMSFLAMLVLGVYVVTLQAHAERLERERNVAQTERGRAQTAQFVAEEERARAMSDRDKATEAQRLAEAERERAETEWERAEAERQRARSEAEKAKQVAGFLVDLFSVADPDGTTIRGDTLSARTILQRGVERIRQSLQDQPDVRASLLATIGAAYSGFGAGEEAHGFLEEALELKEELYGRSDPRAVAILERLARARLEAWHFEAAEELYREVLAIRWNALPRDTLRVVANMEGLARAIQRTRSDSSEVLLRRAVVLRKRVQGETHPEYLRGLTQLASLLRSRGDFERADTLYRTAIVRQRALGEPGRRDLTRSLHDLGYLNRLRGDYDVAEMFYRESLQLQREVFGEWHPQTSHYLLNFAHLHRLRGNYTEAEYLLRERLAIEERTWPEGHWRIGRAIGEIAATIVQSGQRLSEAEELLRAALAIYATSLGESHSWTANARSWVGNVLRLQGVYDVAEVELLASYEILKDASRGEALSFRETNLGFLVELYEDWGKDCEAERYLALRER
jgi:eukaryotic-like serine/threonine-protein kinase